ncbi:MAG: hypothetical protein ACXABC_16500 [Candidatus Thorarchaeota archaeon]
MHSVIEYPHKRKRDWAIYLMILLLLLLPCVFVVQIGQNWHYYQITAILWDFKDWSTAAGDLGVSYGMSDPILFLGTLVLTGFRSVFAYQIYRHKNGLTTQRNVWIFAVLSLFPLAPISILQVIDISFTAGTISGPIPIFLIIGLIMDRYLGIEPTTQPWETPEETKPFLEHTDDKS